MSTSPPFYVVGPGLGGMGMSNGLFANSFTGFPGPSAFFSPTFGGDPFAGGAG